MVERNLFGRALNPAQPDVVQSATRNVRRKRDDRRATSRDRQGADPASVVRRFAHALYVRCRHPTACRTHARFPGWRPDMSRACGRSRNFSLPDSGRISASNEIVALNREIATSRGVSTILMNGNSVSCRSTGACALDRGYRGFGKSSSSDADWAHPVSIRLTEPSSRPLRPITTSRVHRSSPSRQSRS